MTRDEGDAFTHLVLVPGHAAFRAEVPRPPDDARWDEHWVLEPHQSGEPPLYLAHAEEGARIALSDPAALLVCAGRRREGSGSWSEGGSYLAILCSRYPELRKKGRAEELSRDSFENLLFSLVLFVTEIGAPPRRVTVTGFRFKEARFRHHARALRVDDAAFHYQGVNDPVDLDAARRGEARTLAAFERAPYGNTREILEKRRSRESAAASGPEARHPALVDFLAFLEGDRGAGREYPDRFPWEAVS
jgi:hypothetical protein